jgi:hypothetical protein
MAVAIMTGRGVDLALLKLEVIIISFMTSPLSLACPLDFVANYINKRPPASLKAKLPTAVLADCYTVF